MSKSKKGKKPTPVEQPPALGPQVVFTMAQAAMTATATYYYGAGGLVAASWVIVAIAVAVVAAPTLRNIRVPLGVSLWAMTVVLLADVVVRSTVASMQRKPFPLERSFSDDQYAIVFDALKKSAPPEKERRLATINNTNTVESFKFARELRAMFEEAGWDLRERVTLKGQLCGDYNLYVGCLVVNDVISEPCMHFKRSLKKLDVEYYDELSDDLTLGDIVIKVCRTEYTE